MSHVDEGTLHAYLDGELPSAERTTLEAHLASCGTCRATLTEERALRERAMAVLGSARPIERPAPPLEQLRREPQRSPWRVRRSFAWAASIVLALGLGYYMRNPIADREAPFGHQMQRVALDQNRDAVSEVDKGPAAPPAPTPAQAPARAQNHSGDRRAASRADEVASAIPSADSSLATGKVAAAPATKPADTTRLDASAVSGALERAERNPAALPAPTIAVDRVAKQLPATNWPVISRRMAKSILGEEPVGLPGLATRDFRRVPGTEGTIVVEQAIDSSTVIQIFQRPAYPYDSSGSGGYANEGRLRSRAYSSEDQARERGNRLFARFVRGLRVEITGPLSTDSLNRLLEQVAPLPPLP